LRNSLRMGVDMGSLAHLIYASAALKPQGREELMELLDVARWKNAELGVTGMLLYCEGSFFQVLEGEAETLERLFAMIRKDPRHHRITKIIRDLVDFSRPSNYQIQPTDIVKVLTDSVEIVKMGKKAKEVTFYTHVRHPIPLLSLVPDQIAQVFIGGIFFEGRAAPLLRFGVHLSRAGFRKLRHLIGRQPLVVQLLLKGVVERRRHIHIFKRSDGQVTSTQIARVDVGIHVDCADFVARAVFVCFGFMAIIFSEREIEFIVIYVYTLYKFRKRCIEIFTLLLTIFIIQSTFMTSGQI